MKRPTESSISGTRRGGLLAYRGGFEMEEAEVVDVRRFRCEGGEGDDGISIASIDTSSGSGSSCRFGGVKTPPTEPVECRFVEELNKREEQK